MNSKKFLISYITVFLLAVTISLYWSGLIRNVDFGMYMKIIIFFIVVILGMPNFLTPFLVFNSIALLKNKKTISHKNEIIYVFSSLFMVTLSSYSLFWLINNFDHFKELIANSYLCLFLFSSGVALCFGIFGLFIVLLASTCGLME